MCPSYETNTNTDRLTALWQEIHHNTEPLGNVSEWVTSRTDCPDNKEGFFFAWAARLVLLTTCRVNGWAVLHWTSTHLLWPVIVVLPFNAVPSQNLCTRGHPIPMKYGYVSYVSICFILDKRFWQSAVSQDTCNCFMLKSVETDSKQINLNKHGLL